MNNQTFAIESFISFCDNMMIAEESIKEMNNTFNNALKELENINDNIKKNHGNLKKQCELIKNAINILNQVKSEISIMDESTFDKNVNKLKNMVVTCSGILSGSGIYMLLRFLQKKSSISIPFKLITSVAVGTATFLKAFGFVEDHSKPNKNGIMNKIDQLISDYQLCVKVLSNPKYAKIVSGISSSDKDYLTKIKNINKEQAYPKVKELAFKIFKSKYEEIKKIAKSHGVSVKFSTDEDKDYNEFRLFVIDTNGTNGVGTDKFYDCYGDFADIDLETQFKSQIKKIENEFDVKLYFDVGDADDENFSYCISFK